MPKEQWESSETHSEKSELVGHSGIWWVDRALFDLCAPATWYHNVPIRHTNPGTRSNCVFLSWHNSIGLTEGQVWQEPGKWPDGKRNNHLNTEKRVQVDDSGNDLESRES